MMDKLVQRFRQLLADRKYAHIALCCAALLLAALAVVYVTYLLLSFLFSKPETVAVITVGYFMIAHHVKGYSNSRLQAIQSSKAAELENQKAIDEGNYSVVRQHLFTVLPELSDLLGLVKPLTLSALDSPNRVIHQNGYVLFEYMVAKQSAVDTKNCKLILQKRITQKLYAGEFPGLSQNLHIYNGTAYPLLQIEQVSELPDCVLIHVAWANDAFCRHLENRALLQQVNAAANSINTQDSNF